jgi:hypothetical protein
LDTLSIVDINFVDSFSPKWLEFSVAVLHNMAEVCSINDQFSKMKIATPKISKSLVNAGVLTPLSDLLGSSNLELVQEVVLTLASIADDEELRDRIIEANVLPPLVDLIIRTNSMVTYFFGYLY